MMQLELEPEVQERLERMAEQDHATPAFYVQEAILRFLEDREDYLAGIRSLEKQTYTVSLEEMERRDAMEG